MPDKAWKALERRLARRFGTERNSKYGLGSNVSDIETDRFSIEVKLRKALPQWLKDAVKQSKDNRTDGKTPILILKEKYKSDDQALVICELGDVELPNVI